MSERDPSRLNPEEERFEDLHEALFGQLEELVNEAEDLAEDASAGVVEEGEEGAQLWAELRERYATALKEWALRQTSINEATRVKLEGSLLDLGGRAEKAFGKRLVAVDDSETDW